MPKIKIEAVPLPDDSLVKKAFSTINYADAYRAKLPENRPHDLASVVKSFAGAPPPWLGRLMKIRNSFSRLLGLEPKAGRLRSSQGLTLEPGAKIGIFKIFQKTANEVLMGEDDAHLNYRVSILLQPEQNACWATISTIVHYNNWRGRLYFIPVRPFHCLIVTTMLKNMVRAE
jgi:hypothetical protein